MRRMSSPRSGPDAAPDSSISRAPESGVTRHVPRAGATLDEARRFSAHVAHDLRNPLGSISNTVFLLRRLLAHDGRPEVATALEWIEQEAWRASRIVSESLDVLTVRPAELESVDVASVVRGALHQEEISSRIRVEEHYAELPSLELDPDQLEAATRRLLRNAVEAMPDGGTLAVSVYRSSSRERMDGAASEHAVIAIADTGCGVPAALGPRIFEPFVTTKPRARGLGLPVARVLVENQGGRLERGPAAMGACFELRFPLLELP